MSHLEKLYLQLPISLQNLVCSLEGWKIKRQRFSTSFVAALQEAEKRSYWSEEQVKDYQDRRLQSFVLYAASNIPFYKRRFADHGIDPRAIRGREDLSKLPILTKAEVQSHYTGIVSSAIPKSSHIIAHTSGTTGSGLRFATTRSALDELWASLVAIPAVAWHQFR